MLTIAASIAGCALTCARAIRRRAIAGSAAGAQPAQRTGAREVTVQRLRCRSFGALVEKKGSASGVGAVAGGVLGGVLGHQFGSGRGNTAATIVGAGAGAYAGNEVEKNKKKQTYWSVSP